MLKQKQKINFCTQHVVNLYFSENSMNNLSSYYGLTDSRIRASDKDSPVQETKKERRKKRKNKKNMKRVLDT